MENGSETKPEEQPPRECHTDWASAIIGVAVAAAVVGTIYALCWLAVSITRADREYRSTRTEQCRTIDSEAARGLCVVGT